MKKTFRCYVLNGCWVGFGDLMLTSCIHTVNLLKPENHRISCTFSLQTFVLTKLTFQHIWSLFVNQSWDSKEYLSLKGWVWYCWLINKLAWNLIIDLFCDFFLLVKAKEVYMYVITVTVPRFPLCHRLYKIEQVFKLWWLL